MDVDEASLQGVEEAGGGLVGTGDALHPRVTMEEGGSLNRTYVKHRGSVSNVMDGRTHPWKFPGTVILRLTRAFITLLTIS